MKSAIKAQLTLLGKSGWRRKSNELLYHSHMTFWIYIMKMKLLIILIIEKWRLKSVYTILLYAHIKKTFFSFLMNVFWGVDSKSAILFFWLALENPDNPKRQIFRIIEVFRCRTNKWTSAFVSAGQKALLLIPRQFGKLPLFRRSTIANPEYRQLYFIPISPC